MTTPQETTASDDHGVGPTRTERVRVGLRRLERATLRLERPINAAVGGARFNPLHHTGGLSVLFFVVVLISGIYLTAWFQFGFEDSYLAVERLENNFVGRFVRAIHRYGSVALVVTSLLHGWRAFAQDRFRGPRWLAWVTGIWMVGFLWVIGVTGYWLLWDVRAQALNEVLIRALRGSVVGLDFLLDNLLTPAAGTGWPFILLLLVVHIALSLVIGALLIYHLRRLTPRRWFPPTTWTVGAGISLVILSVLWPVGILPAFDSSVIPTSFPVDPFYLFLFPLGLNFSPWVVWGLVFVSGLLLTVVPWIGRRSMPGPIVIDDDRCTGCTLCVADCPYGALEMVPRGDGVHRQVAVLVADRCVSCGVCVGSCTDDALSLPDEPVDEITGVALAVATATPGVRIVITCERLAGDAGVVGTDSGDAHIIPVNCAGAVHPHLAERVLDAGAGSVQIAGCPAGDCANRFGNTYAQARLDRLRVPRLKRRYVDAPIDTDWVSPVDAGRAFDDPGRSPVADAEVPAPTPNVARIAIVMTVVALITVILTNLPFDPGFPPGPVVSIAMDHQGGAVLLGFEGEPALDEGAPSRLVVTIGGDVVLDRTYPTVSRDGAEVSQALERFEMPPGVQQLRIDLYDRIDPSYFTVLFDDGVAVPVGNVLEFAFIDAQIESRADAGRSLYFETTLGVNAGCRVCHSLKPGEVIVGPSFDGVATAARTRVPGLTAEEYLHQSIVDPNAYIVDGFEPDVMLQNFEDLLTAEEIDNLVAFLLTLE